MDEITLLSIQYTPSETKTFTHSPSNPEELKRNNFSFLKKQANIYIYTKPCFVCGIFLSQKGGHKSILKAPLKDRIVAYFQTKSISKAQVEQFHKLAQNGTLRFYKNQDELIIRKEQTP